MNAPADPPTRRRRYDPVMPYVRRFVGRHGQEWFQARFFFDRFVNSVNLGFYPTAGRANKAALAFLAAWTWDVADYPATIAELARRGLIRPVLPKWVRRAPRGGFLARARRGGRPVQLRRHFDSPDAAFFAMLQRLQ
jgi:hypothetical protein